MISRFIILSAFLVFFAPISSAQDAAQPALIEAAAADLNYVDEEDMGENVLTLDTPQNGNSSEGVSPEIDAVKAAESVLFASVNPNRMRSLLYNEWEHAAVMDAIAARSYIDVEAYRKRELGGTPEESGDSFGEDAPAEVIDSIREITLGGILYAGKKDWTIWLNGQRVTPKAQPEEIVSLKVFKDYIELKWLDQKSLKVYPIRLRPHQRFNLDNNLFLPG